MNSEAAGTEWIRKAADEIRADLVAQAVKEGVNIVWHHNENPARMETIITKHFEARPVPQPATPNEELDKLRAKAARKSGDVIWLEGVLRKYGRHLSTCVKDKTYNVPCSCAWDNLALSINLPSPVIGVPQPATEPDELTGKLVAFLNIVASNGANRVYLERVSKELIAALALRDVSQGQWDWAPLAKKLSAQLKSMGADVHPSKLEIWLEQNTALVPVSSEKEK